MVDASGLDLPVAALLRAAAAAGEWKGSDGEEAVPHIRVVLTAQNIQGPGRPGSMGLWTCRSPEPGWPRVVPTMW